MCANNLGLMPRKEKVDKLDWMQCSHEACGDYFCADPLCIKYHYENCRVGGKSVLHVFFSRGAGYFFLPFCGKN